MRLEPLEEERQENLLSVQVHMKDTCACTLAKGSCLQAWKRDLTRNRALLGL